MRCRKKKKKKQIKYGTNAKTKQIFLVHLLKMYLGRDCLAKFAEHNETKANCLYTIFHKNQ